jgi:hypothetical protein
MAKGNFRYFFSKAFVSTDSESSSYPVILQTKLFEGIRKPGGQTACCWR